MLIGLSSILKIKGKFSHMVARKSGGRGATTPKYFLSFPVTRFYFIRFEKPYGEERNILNAFYAVWIDTIQR